MTFVIDESESIHTMWKMSSFLHAQKDLEIACTSENLTFNSIFDGKSRLQVLGGCPHNAEPGYRDFDIFIPISISNTCIGLDVRNSGIPTSFDFMISPNICPENNPARFSFLVGPFQYTIYASQSNFSYFNFAITVCFRTKDPKLLINTTYKISVILTWFTRDLDLEGVIGGFSSRICREYLRYLSYFGKITDKTKNPKSIKLLPLLIVYSIAKSIWRAKQIQAQVNSDISIYKSILGTIVGSAYCNMNKVYRVLESRNIDKYDRFISKHFGDLSLDQPHLLNLGMLRFLSKDYERLGFISRFMSTVYWLLAILIHRSETIISQLKSQFGHKYDKILRDLIFKVNITETPSPSQRCLVVKFGCENSASISSRIATTLHNIMFSDLNFTKQNSPNYTIHAKYYDEQLGLNPEALADRYLELFGEVADYFFNSGDLNFKPYETFQSIRDRISKLAADK